MSYFDEYVNYVRDVVEPEMQSVSPDTKAEIVHANAGLDAPEDSEAVQLAKQLLVRIRRKSRLTQPNQDSIRKQAFPWQCVDRVQLIKPINQMSTSRLTNWSKVQNSSAD